MLLEFVVVRFRKSLFEENNLNVVRQFLSILEKNREEKVMRGGSVYLWVSVIQNLPFFVFLQLVEWESPLPF